jgi:hypothetical protein
MPTTLVDNPRLGDPLAYPHVPGVAGQPAQVSLAQPAAAAKWVVRRIGWSYDGDQTGISGTLTIAFGSTTIVYYVTTAGPGELQFPSGVGNAPGQAVTVTLSAVAGRKAALDVQAL